MASSKNTKEEKDEKKSKVKAKETKLAKPETKKKANPSPKKPKKDNNKKAGIQNGTVTESEDEVVITTPATSNDNDSQEDSETNQDSRSQETKKPNKSGKKMQLDNDDDDEDEKEDSKICNFPMRRIKRIFKTQSSDCAITGEAAFLVNKATDKFLEQFCEDAYKCCVKDRKKSLAYKHLASVVSEQRRYDFLSDFVPEKIKAEDALAQRKLTEEGKNRTLETQ